MLEKIIYILGFAFLFYVGYYLITSIGIFKKRKKVTNNNDDKKNFLRLLLLLETKRMLLVNLLIV